MEELDLGWRRLEKAGVWTVIFYAVELLTLSKRALPPRAIIHTRDDEVQAPDAIIPCNICAHILEPVRGRHNVSRNYNLELFEAGIEPGTI
jgi:hypothetical protein